MLVDTFDYKTVCVVAGSPREGGQSRGERVLVLAVLQRIGHGGSERSAVWPAVPISAGH